MKLVALSSNMGSRPWSTETLKQWLHVADADVVAVALQEAPARFEPEAVLAP